jgi:hypothetical protein
VGHSAATSHQTAQPKRSLYDFLVADDFLIADQ